MKMLSSLKLAVAAASLLGLGVVQSKANLTLTIFQPGFAFHTVVDTANVGDVSFFGTYGTFSTNIVVGFSNKLTAGGADAAVLQIKSLEVTSTSVTNTPQTLNVYLSDDNFTFPGSSTDEMLMDSALGGTLTPSTAGDSVTFESTALPTGADAGTQSFVSLGGLGGTSAFQVPDAQTTFIRGSSYSLENTTTITLSTPGEQTNISGTTTVTVVPEPVTLGGMVLAVAGLAGTRRRRLGR